MNPNEAEDKTGETPVQSWKEIGAYLQRNAVTTLVEFLRSLSGTVRAGKL